MHGNIMTVFSNPFNIRRAVTYADLVVGAVLVPAARTPVLVTEEMVKGMKRGSVIVDVAVDQGSCVETMRPTSHSDPVFTLHDVIHYGVTNIPAAVPRTSTRALTNVTTPYLANMADHGVHAALAADPALARGVNVMAGKVVQPEVARTFGYEAADLSALLAG
jgi:alanine dehydrogenase